MIGGLIRLLVLAVVLVAAAAFFLGYRWGGDDTPAERPVGTTQRDAPVDPARAREAGADVAEKVAAGANRAGEVLGDVSLTAKVKAKIALDDTMDGSDVSVEADGSTVTLGGRATAAQKERALGLTRETDGVTSVIDRIDAR